MLVTSLGHDLSDVHDIYQMTEVSEDLLEDQPPLTYIVTCQWVGKLACPFLQCKGVLKDGWNMRRHFWDVHPKDLVVVSLEGQYQ